MESEATGKPGTAAVADPGIAGLESVFADLEKRLDDLVEARLDAVAARRQEAERMALAEQFAERHPDFRELAASGALDAQKRDNPLLDDVGAYYAHHLSAQQQVAAEELAKARAEAETEAEARTIERVRSKRLAAALGASPSATAQARTAGADADLAAPEQFGGINAVLAARMAARRRNAGL
ncbi:hypothetical protein [Desulfovibrio sp. TomC]|uniref:hypothetical protein n=1 Tax=Desulfovibrio sp. TomC TaxID=1562888 RepID=UPI0005741FB1|nr:hypothetical protein [Desulfovibrio sp. TomC]KHK02079.1 hypothetical protein NY78_2563 [Desulfovibrio sp. TomC]